MGERIGKVLTALRLFKQGATGFNIIRTRCVLDLPFAGMATRMGLLHGAILGSHVHPERNREGRIRGLLEHNRQAGPRTAPCAEVAVRRLSYAYERRNLETSLET